LNLPPAALRGEATSTSNSNIGVLGVGDGSTGIGVAGITNGSGSGGQADAIGVLALATSTTGKSTGLSAQIVSPDGTAIEAQTSATGLIFEGSSDDSSSGNPKFVITHGGGVIANGQIIGKAFFLGSGNMQVLTNGNIGTVGTIEGESLTTSGNVTVGGSITSTGDVNTNGTVTASIRVVSTGDMVVGGNGLIVGTLRVSNIPGGGNAPLCTLSTAPNIIVFCSSSLRYKKEINAFTGGMDIVNRLHPISFMWKENGTPGLGLGAEDVAKVEPRLTFNNSKGELEGVKYGELNVVLINAIKQQEAQIDRQQAQINALTRLVRRYHRATIRKAR
jgi:hypothetical protein